MYKKRTKCWKIYHIREGDIKNYKDMPRDKTRPVLVISDTENLYDKCLIVELGSHKNNSAHILWYTYFSKKHNCEKESWIKPDCMHTINRWYLTREKQSHSERTISSELKMQIFKYIESLLEKR